MSLPSFKQYLVEEQREVFFTFGRMNPPTIGHGKLMNVMSTKSGKNPYKIYVSQSQDAKKNPLTYEQKIKHLRKMFPKHARSIILDKKARNVFEVATSLYDQGFNKITMVVGADRITEFQTLLNKYNGVKARHGFYNFEKISIVSAGERDPDSEGIEGMSASKQRENAKNNDFTTFAQGVPNTMSSKDAKRLFNDVRSGMGLKEMTQFKNHIELEPVSEMREKFVEGGLFNKNDYVVVKETGDIGCISRLGTNYLILDMDNGSFARKWIEDVELLDEMSFGSSSIWSDLGFTGVSNFFSQMTPAGKRRWQYAVKQYDRLKKDEPKMSPGNRAYQAAKIADVDIRGLQDYIKKMKKNRKEGTDQWYDDQPEWGTSAATKKAKKNIAGQEKAYVAKKSPMTEEVTQKQLNDLEKFGDRLLAKFDIDIEFTRHFADRMNDARNKPAITVSEIQRLFKKIAKEKGRNIKKYGDAEAVLKDMQSDLNLPVAVNYKNGEFEVVNKTIMRKKDFKTTSPVVKYESFVNEDEIDSARARIALDKKQQRDQERREKERNNLEYDRILDRARLARARRKNRQTGNV